MTEVRQSEVFDCSVEQFYQIITDYEKYPEFLTEVSDCQILQEKAEKKLIEYKIHIIKSFAYRLWMTENKALHAIEWTFAGGAIFKSNNGSWHLKEQAGKCHATFHLACRFKIFIPGAITKSLLQSHLPNMMASYHKRVKELYGTEK